MPANDAVPGGDEPAKSPMERHRSLIAAEEGTGKSKRLLTDALNNLFVRIRNIFKLVWTTDTSFNKGDLTNTEVSGTGDAAGVQLAEFADNDDDIDYVTAGDYTLSDGAKLEVASNEARLKALSGSSTNWIYTTPGNYTYDADKILVDGSARLFGNQKCLEFGSPANTKLRMSGTNSYVQGVGTISVSAWIYPTQLNAQDQIYTNYYDSGDRPWYMILHSGKLSVLINDGSWMDGNTTLTINNWYHVVITYDMNGTPAAQVNLYVNGANDGIHSKASTLNTSPSEDRMAQNFSGKIDEVTVWDRELTSAEVTELYSSGKPGIMADHSAYTDCLGYWQMGDDDTYPTITDRKGSYDFTMTNMDSGDIVTATGILGIAADNPTIETDNGYVFTAALNTFTETATKTGSDEIKYQLSSDNGSTWEYWTGSIWAPITSTTTQIVPTAITTVAGTHDAGNLASIQTLDGSTYDISELGGSPPVLRADIDFTNIPQPPTQITIHAGYDGNLSHIIDVDIWNDNLSQWDTLGQIPDNLGVITQYNFTVTGTKADYLDGSGNVQIRINHTSNGNMNHNLFIDYVYLLLDSDPTDTWYYDNEVNIASTVHSNIGTLALSGTLKVRAFLHSDDSTTSPELDNIYAAEPTTYSTTDNLYIDTKDATQVDPANFTEWLTTTITSTLPANTDARLLFSVNDRVSWLTWSGSVWQAPGSATTRTNATVLATAVTNFASLPSTKPLDVRLFLYTSDMSVRPTVSNINITSDAGFPTSGTWESNVADSDQLNTDYGTITFNFLLPAGTVTLKARAANSLTEVAAASYGSDLSDGGDAGVTGQFIQFKLTFTGAGIQTPFVDEIAVEYVSNTVQNVTA